jgi:integrase/recombinase XerC
MIPPLPVRSCRTAPGARRAAGAGRAASARRTPVVREGAARVDSRRRRVLRGPARTPVAVACSGQAGAVPRPGGSTSVNGQPVALRDRPVVELRCAIGVRRDGARGPEAIGANEENGADHLSSVVGAPGGRCCAPTARPCDPAGNAVRNELGPERKAQVVDGVAGTPHRSATSDRPIPRTAHPVSRDVVGDAPGATGAGPRGPRRSAATRLSEGGADLHAVHEQLGHATLATTQFQTHPTVERLKAIHDRTNPRS